MRKKTNQREGEWGGEKNREGVWQPGVCGRSARSRVWEVFVKYLWVGEAGQIRSEQKGNCSCFMNQQWKPSPCLSASPPRITWIKPSSWSRRTLCPTTCWAAGATLYVSLPTRCAAHISPHLPSQRQPVNTRRPPFANTLSSHSVRLFGFLWAWFSPLWHSQGTLLEVNTSLCLLLIRLSFATVRLMMFIKEVTMNYWSGSLVITCSSWSLM